MRWPSPDDEPVWRHRTGARVGTVKQLVFPWALVSWGITALTGPYWFHDVPSFVLPLATNGLLVVCIVGERLLHRGHVDAPTDGLWRGLVALGALLFVAGLGLTVVGGWLAATTGELPR